MAYRVDGCIELCRESCIQGGRRGIALVYKPVLVGGGGKAKRKREKEEIILSFLWEGDDFLKGDILMPHEEKRVRKTSSEGKPRCV